MIKQNEIKVLLMANVHGGNLHHIYADTEILSARLLIILSMARYSQTLTSVYEWHCSHACTLVMGRTLDLPSVIELTPCKYKRVYFYFGVQKKFNNLLNIKQTSRLDKYILLFLFFAFQSLQDFIVQSRSQQGAVITVIYITKNILIHK
jgi:hypothetical protein